MRLFWSFGQRGSAGSFIREALCRVRLIGSWLLMFIVASFATANDPFVYFAGNPANARYRIGGSCSSPSITAIFTSFTTGDSNSTGNPARWTALGFRLHDPLTFDSIAYAPRGQTGVPNLRILITGATTGATPVPDLNNIIFRGDFGTYPGDPPVSGQKDEQIPSYTGGMASTRQLRTTPLGQTITLSPGLYFAIIIGDEDFTAAGPLDSDIALAMGVPGGPKLYYTPRGMGSVVVNGEVYPANWELFRLDPGTDCTRFLNVGLPFRENDPFGNPNDTSPLKWRTYHSPYLYHGVLGFRYSGAQGGRITATAWVNDATLPATVEIIFYKPGTKQRIARFSMPGASGPNYPISTPPVAAGTYDIVIRPIYSRPFNYTTNCPTNLCLTGLSILSQRQGVRIPNVNVSGEVNLGTIRLTIGGDVNGDGVVDDADLLAVLFAFGQSGSNLSEDVNGDTVVDDADLLTVLFSFGSTGEDGDEL